jgi:phosphoribosylamine--glycine ligase
MEIVLLGHMGRDEAAADRLYEHHKLHVLGQWENPGLVEKATASGGRFQVVDSITNVDAIADYVQAVEPDLFFTNFDDALAAGVVDTIQRRIDERRLPPVLLPCPDRATARIEWDKFYLRDIVERIEPSFNPLNFMAQNMAEVDEAVATFASLDKEIAIKPRNLTGGKGVKVQGKHFDTLEEGRAYAVQVLDSDAQSGVEIQEKIEGHEFTLQLVTDGSTIIEPPVTYDYPYRKDGDEGPGTGGMGTFSMEDGRLPFVTEHDYNQAVVLMYQLLRYLDDRGHQYKGVLYPTFFKTTDGLKIVEVNARGGDPELINILDLMEEGTDYAGTLRSIATGELAYGDVRYRKMASAMLYLVSPDYGYQKGPAHEFNMDFAAIHEAGVRVRFAAAERNGNGGFKTVGSSRTVGLSALGETPWQARQKIHDAIRSGIREPLPLHYRHDVGDEKYISDLAQAVNGS